jgi:glycosyltransferase involved in cell wall biosynthesis
MKNMTVLERQASTSQSGESFSPVRICEVEIGEPLPDISATNEQTGQQYQRAQCLIRLHTQPLGLLELPLDESGANAEVYAGHIWQALGEQINAHLREDGLPEVTMLDAAGLPGRHTPRCLQERAAFLQRAPFVSVIISTRDRPDRLARCLPALLALQYPGYEVIVVDNAPSTSATADFIQQTYADEPKIRYVREDRPGLSAARNRGIVEARGEIIAFTDDDVVVDACWLASLARGFEAAENVACVTSLILPLELETPTQLWFEEFGGFNKGFNRRVFDRRSGRKDTPLYPFTAGRFGTGAGMAFTARFLKEERGFDLALGVGSRTCGGEDLAAFFRVVLRGDRLVYEPASLAYHEHRRDYASLQKQMYDYGIGLTAYLTKIVADNPLLLFRIVIRVPQGLFFILSPRSTKNQKKSTHFPKELTNLELKGMLLGSLRYLKGRFTDR